MSMKKLFENWRHYASDTVRLYHFSSADEPVLMLDPKYFLTHRQGYSRRDYQMSGYPRTFFYVDLNDAERLVSSTKKLYHVDVPSQKIYDMMEDSGDLKSMSKGPYDIGLDYDKLFQNIVDNGYIGAYYKTNAMEVVVLFEPIEVAMSEDE
jgi:hypothetical protein